MGTGLIIAISILFLLGIILGAKEKAKKNDNYLDEIKARLNTRMVELNSMQRYVPDVENNIFQENEYDNLNERNSETEYALIKIMQLSMAGILDIFDSKKPVYIPKNLDFYFESWVIMKFTTFEDRLSYNDHLEILSIAIGKYFIETHNFKWAERKNDINKDFVLINTEKRVEIDPLVSLKKCIKKKQLNPFEGLEIAYLESSASTMKGVSIH